MAAGEGGVTDLRAYPALALLRLQAEAMEELYRRGVVRTRNNPVGDLAEELFCRAFRWKREGNSARSVDAVAEDGARHQIKARRLTAANTSRQLSAIRDLAGAHFDFLAGALFDFDFTVRRAAIIPHATVLRRARYVAHTNSSNFMLTDEVWREPGVIDVTQQLRAVEL